MYHMIYSYCKPKVEIYNANKNMCESEKERTSKASHLLVAAIDFGTTYSGYAYSFKENWATVRTNNWKGGEQLSYKAPTALLLNPDQSFKAFGFEAESSYANLTTDDDCREYYFFKRFKLILKTELEERVHRKTQCVDISGRRVDAAAVFTHSIGYLKKHMLEALNDSHTFEITIKDIDFVITVPAIWDDTAKMFMREAAINAGIPGNQLLFALEPEAASIYCQLMYLEPNNESSFRVTEKDFEAKYMVVDLGGGTADITLHQLQRNGTIVELNPASGGLWGGTCIDTAFEAFLQDLFGKKTMETFQTDSEYAEDFFDFWQGFEVKKRAFDFEKDSESIHIRIPMGLTDIAKEIKKEQNVDKIIEMSELKGKGIKFDQGKLHIPAKMIKGIFQSTADKIVGHLRELMKEVGKDLRVILMVGGFSECGFIQNCVRETFEIKGKRRVIAPNQCGLAVLKGAVYFGHHPEMISERVARYTYGVQTWPRFDRTKHKEHKRVVIDYEDRCKDVFFTFVTKGDRLTAGSEKNYIFKALKPNENSLECGIFISNNRNPTYVDDDGCQQLGILEVLGVEGGANIEESLVFGHTELQVKARNCETNKKYSVTFDLLSEEIKYPQKKKT